MKNSIAAIDHFIDGKVVANTSGRTQDVFNPATGSVTGRAGLAAADQVNSAVASAKAAFRLVQHPTDSPRPCDVQVS